MNVFGLVSMPFDPHGEVEEIVRIDEALPIDINQVVDDSVTSCMFTGKHDHGALPILNSTGYYAELVSALYSAKATSDAILTKRIQVKEESVTPKSKRIKPE